MSLFNQTVSRLDKAEQELAAERKRCADLERLLKYEQVKTRRSGNTHSGRSFQGACGEHTLQRDVNSLSEEDTDKLFAQLDEAKMAEQADAADLKSAAPMGVSVRDRLLAPFQKVCALLKVIRT